MACSFLYYTDDVVAAVVVVVVVVEIGGVDVAESLVDDVDQTVAHDVDER